MRPRCASCARRPHFFPTTESFMHFSIRRTTTITLAAAAMLAMACGERGPSVPSDPLMGPRPSASRTLTPITTVWDFVTLAGTTGGLGQTHTFTIAGAGSVVASAVGTVPAGATAFPQVSAKDEGVAAERG